MSIAQLDTRQVILFDLDGTLVDSATDLYRAMNMSLNALQLPLVTLEQVRAILTEKSLIGYTTQVRELLSRYGATKLSGVDPSEYAALLADAEVLGNG